jgi:hypothetical protein
VKHPVQSHGLADSVFGRTATVASILFESFGDCFHVGTPRVRPDSVACAPPAGNGSVLESETSGTRPIAWPSSPQAGSPASGPSFGRSE